MEISGLSYMLQNSLLVDNLISNPPETGDYSSYNSYLSSTLITDVEDYADISDEAYKLSILDGVQSPQSSTAPYNNDFNNMIVNYLNKDLDL